MEFLERDLQRTSVWMLGRSLNEFDSFHVLEVMASQPKTLNPSPFLSLFGSP